MEEKQCPFALRGALGQSVPPVQIAVQQHPLGWPLVVVAPPPMSEAAMYGAAGLYGWVHVLDCAPHAAAEVLNKIFKAELRLNSAGAIEVYWQLDAVYARHFIKNDRLAGVMLAEDGNQIEVVISAGPDGNLVANCFRLADMPGRSSPDLP